MGVRRALSELPARFGRNHVRVLCYHDVPDRDWFHGHMRALADRGYTVLSLERFTAWLHGTAEVVPPAVLITFDGGYRDQRDNAVPVLHACCFPAVFFPITQALEEEAGSGEQDAASLGRRDLAELVDAGHAVGSHTHTHPDLTVLSPAEVSKEIATSKGFLEDLLGRPVTAFCYPYGDHNVAVRELVRAAGFETAFTVDLGGVLQGDDAYALKRLCVLGRPGPAEFGALLSGCFPVPGTVLLYWKLRLRLAARGSRARDDVQEGTEMR